MKVLSPSSSGKLETDSNNNNTPSRSSELVRYSVSNTNYDTDIINLLKILKKLTSSLVRLGKTERNLKMKKLLKWLFVREQAETVETPVWTFEKNASEPSRDRYNKIHRLGETLI